MTCSYSTVEYSVLVVAVIILATITGTLAYAVIREHRLRSTAERQLNRARGELVAHGIHPDPPRRLQ